MIEECRQEVRAGLPGLMPRLWRYGLVLSGEQCLARQLAQTTARQALDRSDQFVRGTRLDHWCFALMAAIWKGHSERGSAEAARSCEEHPSDEGGALLAKQALSTLQGLSDAHRETVLLVYVEGYSQSEAASCLRVPVETVTSNLVRARQHLKGAVDAGGPMTAEPYSDEEIVAFLDEEMADDEQVRFARAANEDEGFAARIEALIIDTDALRDTFDTLLNDAPFIPVHEAMPYTEETRGAGTSRGVRHWGAGRMALAALVLLGLGIALGMIIANRFEPRDWHSAVLAHQSLYGAETLNAIPVAARVAELSDASAALGITLPPSALEIDGLVYARAHVFEFESRSLVRIAYLTPNEQPAALYLMMTGGQDAPPAISTHQMMATVKWQRNGYGFILVGRADQDVLRAAQVQLASQISL